MAKLWTLAVLCVGYGAWIVLALPRADVARAGTPSVPPEAPKHRPKPPNRR
jgi:hypothetical protein